MDKSDFILSIIAGWAGGLAIVIGALVAELVEQKFNILLISAVSAFLVLIIIGVILYFTRKK